MRFQGKTALVTGASAGIGFAIARALVAEGANVVLTARREAGLVDASAALGPRVSYVAGDMTDQDTSERAVAHAADTYDGLDLLVCNAGVLLPGSILNQPLSEVDHVIGVNLRGTIASVAAAAPALAKRPDTAIVVITSSIGRKPAAGLGVYGATKAALHYLVPTWATELASLGIRVNGVCAGITETPGLQAGSEAIPGLRDMVIGTNLIKRIADAEEIARPVLTLLDERESAFVTGSVWDIDGGYQRGGRA
ncbi:NAD(P)-dependent dehydrogenase (short-subunit alcohol dehydrogenase family) [Herbihabitans rhizosphaerae]|uniref:NAD(P)-dependent dehydrogenase (Short-subunit alcohol dehydrogenase family) n=1 Tax=Herbihabitans rhizosphaerae TaxID=1872711 RepID=A0A4Q7KG95_9PSEU|nr:SDR family oxidoreductase [Herbihabitans rhizosphaerae]RZS31172.1 NAD(P)-dependent dehydrogenase (short-subunit alcohol dehydrogenase family) [Herbihabitans rhizosphaerae]